MHIIRFFYTCLLYLLFPCVLWLPHGKTYKRPSFGKRWVEHFGFSSLPPLPKKPIWLHAAECGRDHGCKAFLQKLSEHYSNTPLLVTTTTSTGQQTLENLKINCAHQFAPLDYPGAVGRF